MSSKNAKPKSKGGMGVLANKGLGTASVGPSQTTALANGKRAADHPRHHTGRAC